MVVEAGLSRAVYEPPNTMRWMKDNLYGGSAQKFATVVVKSIFLFLRSLDALQC